MRSFLRVFTTLVALSVLVQAPVRSQTSSCDQPTTLLIVRHADRQGSDDALSPAGVQRARDLAWVAGLAGVSAIYHSDTQRTQLTAQPFADAAAIAPVVYPAKEVDALVRDILAGHCGDTVLVVGHSNTVPLIVAAAGGPASPDLPENRYDDLFVVTVYHGRTGVVHLRYGALSR